MNKHQTGKNLIQAILDKHPNHGALTIAKAAYKQAPECFASVESARTLVRKIIGQSGARNRKETRDKSRYRTPRAPGELPKMPEAVSTPWEVFQLPARKLGVLSDVHIPYHDPKALAGAVKRLQIVGVDTILLNGDIADFFSISRWEKDPRKRNFAGEINSVRQFLAYIRGQFPKARIVYKLGNHEEWWHKYLFNKAPELLGLDVTTFEALVDAKKHGVEIVDQQRKIAVGGLTILHGHELPKGLTNPVNPARGAFLRTLDTVLIGHHHRTSEHTEQTMGGKTIATWSTGCLCELTPEYARINRWNHGAATVETDQGGDYRVHSFRVIGGKTF